MQQQAAARLAVLAAALLLALRACTAPVPAAELADAWRHVAVLDLASVSACRCVHPCVFVFTGVFVCLSWARASRCSDSNLCFCFWVGDSNWIEQRQKGAVAAPIELIELRSFHRDSAILHIS